MYSRSIWSSLRALGWITESGLGSIFKKSSKSSFEIRVFERVAIYDIYPVASSLESKSHDLGLRIQSRGVPFIGRKYHNWSVSFELTDIHEVGTDQVI